MTHVDDSLRDRRALVGGASRGIGLAAARALAERGAEVVLLARHESTLQEALGTLPVPGGRRHRVLAVDLERLEEVEAAVHGLLAEAGPVHVLVNNGGGPPAGVLCEAAWEGFPAAFRAHVGAAHVLTRALLPGMREAGYGRIVNIISTSVKQPIPGLGVSNTIRGAMANWAKTLAGEVAAAGITVNNVLPGATRTERLVSILGAWAGQRGITPEAMEQKMLESIPARRFAAPEEIGEAVAFLASPAAGYINGINLPVDGGRTGSL